MWTNEQEAATLFPYFEARDFLLLKPGWIMGTYTLWASAQTHVQFLLALRSKVYVMCFVVSLMEDSQGTNYQDFWSHMKFLGY